MTQLKKSYDIAVRTLNAGGTGAAVAIKAHLTLSEVKTSPAEENARLEAIKSLNQIGRAWYAIAGVQAFVKKVNLQTATFNASFGCARTMFAVPAKGTHYIIAVDVTVDVNGGVVVTQWVTRCPVAAKNIPILLSGKTQALRESELDSDYFEKYSEINAVTGSFRRTPDGMEKAVIARLTEKLNQMRQ